jgi:hypothetical protein
VILGSGLFAAKAAIQTVALVDTLDQNPTAATKNNPPDTRDKRKML